MPSKAIVIAVSGLASTALLVSPISEIEFSGSLRCRRSVPERSQIPGGTITVVSVKRWHDDSDSYEDVRRIQAETFRIDCASRMRETTSLSRRFYQTIQRHP